MNKNEWNRTAVEQNAKADQIGASVGCLFVLAVLAFFLVLAAMAAMG